MTRLKRTLRQFTILGFNPDQATSCQHLIVVSVVELLPPVRDVGDAVSFMELSWDEATLVVHPCHIQVVPLGTTLKSLKGNTKGTLGQRTS